MNFSNMPKPNSSDKIMNLISSLNDSKSDDPKQSFNKNILKNDISL